MKKILPPRMIKFCRGVCNKTELFQYDVITGHSKCIRCGSSFSRWVTFTELQNFMKQRQGGYIIKSNQYKLEEVQEEILKKFNLNVSKINPDLEDVIDKQVKEGKFDSS